MSRENVELVRRAAEAAFRKPKPDFDTSDIIIAISERLAAESDEVAPLSRPMAHAFLGACLGLMQRAAPDGPDAVRALEGTVAELLTRLLLAHPSRP